MNTRRSFIASLAGAAMATVIKVPSAPPVQMFSAEVLSAIPKGISVRYINNWQDPSKSRIDLLPSFSLMYPALYECRIVG